MIIYGWRAKNIKQANLDHFECPSCGQKNSVIAFFSHYVHIFWIPLFPYKKSAEIHCMHCQHVMSEKDTQGEMREQVKQLKQNVSTPKYLFAGLAIIFVLMSFGIVTAMVDDQQEKSYAENPMVGDVIIIKDETETSSYNHYLWKVKAIEGDSLQVSLNAYGYNGVPTKLEAGDGFYNFTIPVHKNEVIDMYTSGKVKRIKRDYGDYSGFNQELEFNLSDTTQFSQ